MLFLTYITNCFIWPTIVLLSLVMMLAQREINSSGLFVVQGLGITMFGMAYMFVHDGLVHRRFTVGPIADFPYLQKVAAAHQVLDFLFGFLNSFFWCL
jgi:hypothetical protein